jgi:3-phosphoshikimate 1-carboxyvinyltransferase
LDCGESGSTLRFLIPVAALLPGGALFTGHGRLMERPLGPYASALGEHGAAIAADAAGVGGISVRGGLKAGAFRLPGDVSSQFVSGLLLALPLLGGDSEIAMESPLQSAGYVDLTIDALAGFGVGIERDGYARFFVRGGQRYRPQRACEVEADFSQAAYYLVAGALGCECECAGLPMASKQGDRAIVQILERSGATVERTPNGGLAARAPKGRLLPQTVDASGIPDLVPPLAALFSFCDGQSRIANAGRLRHKESDRLASVASELRALGASISQEGDSLLISGARSLKGGRAKSWGDHRIAMMAAVAAIGCEGAVTLSGGECVAKSYPGFWEDFGRAPRQRRM